MGDVIEQNIADFRSRIQVLDKTLASLDAQVSEICRTLSNPREAWENLDSSVRLLHNNDFLKWGQALQQRQTTLEQRQTALEQQRAAFEQQRAAFEQQRAAFEQHRAALTLAQIETLIAESGPRYLTTHAMLEMTFPPVRQHKFSSSTTTTSYISTKYPMPPLVLAEWSTFATEAWNLTKEIPDAPLVRQFVPVDQTCRAEADVRALADFSLFKAVNILYETVRSQFDYLSPGSFSGVHGKGRVFGDPDRIWSTAEHSFSKITVEFKTPWALADIKVRNLIESYNNEYQQLWKKLIKEKGKVTRAVEQVYVYMTINRHRYASLSTLDQTWFFRKIEDETLPNQSRIEISPAVWSHSKNPLSITRAWMFILMTIERNADWLYASPHFSQVVPPSFSS
ncbi:hypothetical protein HDU83_008909 [Entophlyctis luteolus]|nr:hypothetical protein HDU83_008909 [Entophlyctis luteolus]